MKRAEVVSGAKFVVATLVGAFAIHGVLAACSGGDSTKNANAQDVTSCTQWEVVGESLGGSELSSSGAVVKADGDTAKTYLTPAGYEPFAVNEYGSFYLRRCVK